MNVSFVSLGCDKNRVNTEQMMALCLQAGITVQEDCPGSDVVVINTCGFIDSAKSEAIDTILSAAQLKDAGEIQKILVTGCLSQRYQADILEELPEIDGIMGTGCFGDIVPALEQVMEGRECRHFADINGPVEELPRVLSTPRHYAYLRIAEGCSNRCAYCVIPSLRGNYRSRRMEDILEEARGLAESGVKELNLVAQDTTKYGQDLYGEYSLDKLLTELCKIDGFHWIRVLYGYPDRVTDGLLEVMAREPKVVKYIDLPLQHASGRVLKEMNRKGDFDSLCALMQRIRDKVPGVVLRTTLIAGFPGETEEDFEQLCKFVRTVRFERLGCFAYSQEEDTPAGEREDQLDPELRMHRADLIMEEQMDIAFEKGRELIGQKMEVLVEGYDEDQQMYYGRSYMDAPDIDTRVSFLTEREEVRPGEFIWVEVLDSVGYDLVGREILA